MAHFIECTLISSLLALFTTFLFYEVLSLVTKAITYRYLSARMLLLILISGIMIAHILSIAVYGVAYWCLVNYLNYLPLKGLDSGGISAYLYYSATTYSSLGVGDIYSQGGLRLITGVETINGLTLIAWSATFTYFAVQKMWDAHGLFLEVKCKYCEKSHQKSLGD